MTLAQEFVDATRRLDAPSWRATHDEVADELGAKQVHYDIADTTRWGHVVEYVYRRGDEYVMVQYTEGSGDSEYDYEPIFTPVRPVEKVIVTYEAIPTPATGVGPAMAHPFS